MKRVITAMVLVMIAGIGAVGSAAASQPSRTDRTGRQDCRTYSSRTVCGEVQLNQKQRACATSMVQQGMTQRRAETECYIFG
ncbi:hypothetical protein [Actinomadura roseirufa]|uniref:hypothetical protein n=1 Tax=Actinomadura roseirufa TaxID=2094049 RepID=UPI00104182BD|nr:hypothetical protein [Actinomadura roseirufa]